MKGERDMLDDIKKALHKFDLFDIGEDNAFAWLQWSVEEIEDYKGRVENKNKLIQQQEEEIRILSSTLNWYALKSNYLGAIGDSNSRVVYDGGSKARQALSTLEPNKGDST